MHRYLVIALLLFLPAGCEEDVGSPEDTDFEEKLVIVAAVREVGADSIDVLCRVSRTMPLRERYDWEAALVLDAEVQLQGEGAWTVPRERGTYGDEVLWASFGDYTHRARLRKAGSSTYRLVVRGRGLQAHADLSLPGQHPATQHTLHRYEERMYTSISMQCSDAFWAFESESSVYDSVRHSWNNLYLFHDEPCTFYGDYPTESRLTRIRYRLRYADIAYKHYRVGLYYGNGGDDFWGSGKNPPFNVQGDGIGFVWWERWTDWVEFSL